MSHDDFDLQAEHRIYLEGLKHFNDGDHFAAHDVWEDAWHQVRHRRREQYYRAIIKGAVCLVLLRQGRAVGTRQVFVDCVNEFQGLPDVFMGLDIPRHIDNLRYAIGPAIEDLEARSVQVDPSRFFEMKLLYDPFVESRNGEQADGQAPRQS